VQQTNTIDIDRVSSCSSKSTHSSGIYKLELLRQDGELLYRVTVLFQTINIFTDYNIWVNIVEKTILQILKIFPKLRNCIYFLTTCTVYREVAKIIRTVSNNGDCCTRAPWVQPESSSTFYLAERVLALFVNFNQPRLH